MDQFLPRSTTGARRDDELNPSSELTGELPIYHTASQPKKVTVVNKKNKHSKNPNSS
jgi:hypothetical protein